LWEVKRKGGDAKEEKVGREKGKNRRLFARGAPKLKSGLWRMNWPVCGNTISSSSERSGYSEVSGEAQSILSTMGGGHRKGEKMRPAIVTHGWGKK